jgi:gluconokinase
MNADLVVMGVAGCGKSSLAAEVARAEALTLIEGDAFHSADSVDKMSRGIELTDADRVGWLDRLGAELQAHPHGVVLACSALRRAYRERLRQASPGLRFAFLEIDRDAALVRVNARVCEHFFSASLVDSQFATSVTASSMLVLVGMVSGPRCLCECAREQLTAAQTSFPARCPSSRFIRPHCTSDTAYQRISPVDEKE